MSDVNISAMQFDRVTPNGSRHGGGCHRGFLYFTRLDCNHLTCKANFVLGGQSVSHIRKFLEARGKDDLVYSLTTKALTFPKLRSIWTLQ